MRAFKQIFGLWGGCLLAAAPAVALSAPPQADAPTEVIVRATRFDPYRGDSVFGALDIGQGTLARSPSIDDSLKSQAQASLFRRSSSLTANPTVQGIGLRAIAPSGAGRALVTLDGIPQNDPFGNWVIWASIPQAAINSIHVLRGAGGGAYGGGALTGVVDMTLVSPRAQTPYARVEWGEGGSGSVSLATGLGGLGLYYDAATLHGDAPVRGAQRGAADVPTFGRDQSGLVNWQTQACPFHLCGQVGVLAGYYDSRRDTGLRGATATASGDQYSLSFTRSPTATANGFRLQLWRKTSDLANRSVSVSADRSTTTLANDQVATPATGDGFSAAIRHQTPQSEWEIGVDGRLNTGEEHEYYKYVAGEPMQYRVAGGTTSLAGIYAEGTRALGALGALTLSGAVRGDVWASYDGHRTEFETTTNTPTLNLSPASQHLTVLSARAGLSYALGAASVVRIAAYNGFRPPSLNELYRPFRIGNTVTEANAGLRPETLKGLEIGYHVENAAAMADIDLFDNIVKNPITNVTVGLGPATFPVAGYIPAGGAYRQRQNVGEIDAYGLEARGRYDVTSHLSLTTSATFTHARLANAGVLTGKRPADAPEYSASIGLDSHMARLRVALDLVVEGDTFDDDLNNLPLKPSQKLHILVDYSLTRHWIMRGQVSNALNAAVPVSNASGIINYDSRRYAAISLIYR